MMNTLVLYDSHFGHTEQLAMEIVEKLKEHGEAESVPIDLFSATDLARPISS